MSFRFCHSEPLGVGISILLRLPHFVRNDIVVEIATSLRSFAFAKCTQRNDKDIIAMTLCVVIPFYVIPSVAWESPPF